MTKQPLKLPHTPAWSPYASFCTFSFNSKHVVLCVFQFQLTAQMLLKLFTHYMILNTLRIQNHNELIVSTALLAF